MTYLPRKQYDETRDATTRRHGIDATKTTDNDSKNNFRSIQACTYLHLHALTSLVCTYLHLHTLTFTCMHLPSLVCTYLHLHTLTFTCMHLPSLAYTYIHLYALTGVYGWRVFRPKFSAWVAWSVKVSKIGTWSVKPVMRGKCDLSYKMRSTRWIIQYRTDRKASYVTVGVGCTEGIAPSRGEKE